MPLGGKNKNLKGVAVTTTAPLPDPVSPVLSEKLGAIDSEFIKNYASLARSHNQLIEQMRILRRELSQALEHKLDNW